MDSTQGITDTLFVMKEDQQYCFLFDSDDPLELYRALLRCADQPGSGISREEAFEVMEGMVPDRLRSI